MASFAQDVATWDTNAGNKQATITPAANGLLVVKFGETGQATPGTITDDQGGTYTLIASCTRSGSGSYGAIAIRDALCANAAHVVTMTAGGTNTGGGLAVEEWTGMTKVGSAAQRSASGTPQEGVQNNQGAGGTPAPALPNSADTNNPTTGLVVAAANPAAVTPPTNWTERRDLGFATLAAGLETVTRDSGFTGTTVTWGSTSGGAFGSIIIELDASAGGTTHALAASFDMAMTVDSVLRALRCIAASSDSTLVIDSALRQVVKLSSSFDSTMTIDSILRQVVLIRASMDLSLDIASVARQTVAMAAAMGITLTIESVLTRVAAGALTWTPLEEVNL